MADFKEVKSPSYEYEISKLTSLYKDAVSEIQKELQRIDLDDYRQANAKATLQSLAEILSSLDDEAKEWVEKNIPKAAVEGVARTLVSLGAAETLEQAQKLAKFNRINANMVRAAVADTQADLLAVTQNINRKTRSAVRQAVAESFRTNMTQGLNGRRTIAKDIRERLEKSAQTGIIDAGGRRWKPEVYADMVTRTKMMETYNEAITNEAVGRGAYYAVISRHGAKDACRFHEGRIIKLSPDAPGTYPSYNELKASGQIWHPNCKHVYSPVRSLSLLPDDIQELNGVKKETVEPMDIRGLTDEKEIIKRGGKVGKGEKLLSELYGMEDEDYDEFMAKLAQDHFKGKHRKAGSAVVDFRYWWVDDNRHDFSMAMENHVSEKYGLSYKNKTKKKLTQREKDVFDFMQEKTIEQFKAEGITHLKVYRGVAWDSKNSWLPDDVEDMTLSGRGMTSWTTRKSVAKSYAEYVDDDSSMGNMAGIIEAIIPIDNVAFTAIIGDTDEVVAIGDIKGAKLISSKKAGGRW